MIKRYDFEDADDWVYEAEDGQYVLFEDHQAEVKRLKEAQEKIFKDGWRARNTSHTWGSTSQAAWDKSQAKQALEEGEG